MVFPKVVFHNSGMQLSPDLLTDKKDFPKGLPFKIVHEESWGGSRQSLIFQGYFSENVTLTLELYYLESQQNEYGGYKSNISFLPHNVIAIYNRRGCARVAGVERLPYMSRV